MSETCKEYKRVKHFQMFAELYARENYIIIMTSNRSILENIFIRRNYSIFKKPYPHIFDKKPYISFEIYDIKSVKNTCLK